MSKHNSSNIAKVALEKVNIVQEEQEVKQVQETIRLKLCIDANYKVKGRYSGQEYLFMGAGSEVDVKKEDVDFLLGLRQSKGCCGGGGGNPVFELA